MTVDGVNVRFLEDGFFVRAVVEGRLTKERLVSFQRRTLGLRQRHFAGAWEIEA